MQPNIKLTIVGIICDSFSEYDIITCEQSCGGGGGGKIQK